MLTYDFHDIGADTLTGYLYRKIRGDILNGRLKPLEKMPSKRNFAKNLGVSVITVENVYAQLSAEGYLDTKPRVGCYVAKIDEKLLLPDLGQTKAAAEDSFRIKESARKPDIVMNLAESYLDPKMFPFNIWAKLVREVLTKKREVLLERAPGTGVPELREAIAQFLLQYQNLRVNPEQIIIGAGTEYLYGLIIHLLGPDLVYAVETPGYPKTERIYESNGVTVKRIPMDGSGIDTVLLDRSKAQVVHISPSHQFPSGITMPIVRRMELLGWARGSCKEETRNAEPDYKALKAVSGSGGPGNTDTAGPDMAAGGRFIIEDDYDSEFRLAGRPVPPLMGIDREGRVIYLNTFTKSVAPTIRISYMVLPEHLMERYRMRLGFYSCTVPSIEQYVLAEFIRRGYFEKHINRMRNYYRQKRDRLIDAIEQSALGGRCHISGADAGLHFLMTVECPLSEKELSARLMKQGIKAEGLGSYGAGQAAGAPCLVVNYSGIPDDRISFVCQALLSALDH